MIITSDDYVAYLNRAAAVIRDSKDYISGLDAATGDGDHWANLNLGFEAIILAGEKLRKLPIDEVFKPVSYTHLDVYKRQVNVCEWTEFSDTGAVNSVTLL